MAGLQNVQPPLGPLFPAWRATNRQRFASDLNTEQLASNNSNDDITGSLRRLRANSNLLLVDMTLPVADANPNVQELFNSRRQSFVSALTQIRIRTPHVPQHPEAAELRWLRDHQAEMAELRGQWLLVAEDQLLAHSTDFGVIRDAIAQYNLTSPFTYYVPTPEEPPFVLL